MWPHHCGSAQSSRFRMMYLLIFSQFSSCTYTANRLEITAPAPLFGDETSWFTARHTTLAAPVMSPAPVHAALRPWLAAPAAMAWSALADRMHWHRQLMVAAFIMSTLLREALLGCTAFSTLLAFALASEFMAAPVCVLADAAVIAACTKVTFRLPYAYPYGLRTCDVHYNRRAKQFQVQVTSRALNFSSPKSVACYDMTARRARHSLRI